MSTERDTYFIIKNSRHQGYYVAKSNFVAKIQSFVTLSIEHIKELLNPKLIRSFDVVPVLIETKRL